MPESLERIVCSLFFMEDVHNDLIEVEQHPTTFFKPLTTDGLCTQLVQGILDLSCDRRHLTLRAACRQNEHV